MSLTWIYRFYAIENLTRYLYHLAWPWQPTNLR